MTGAAGFIGSHVAEVLLDEHAVLPVDDFSAGRVRRVGSVAVERLDVTDPAAVKGAFRAFRPQAVVHLAAQVSVERSLRQPDRDVDVNVYGTMNVLREAARWGAERVVFASTAAVYGDPQRLPVDEDHPCRPLSVYGRSKLTAEWLVEQYARGAGFAYVIMRLGNVYGPRQRPETGPVVAAFFQRVLAGVPPVVYGDGRQTRDFVYVTDVARAFALALTAPSNVTLNIAGGRGITVADLAERVCALAGGGLRPCFGPPRPGDIRHSVLAGQRARNLWGWEPQVGLEAGLEATWEWYRRAAAPATGSDATAPPVGPDTALPPPGSDAAAGAATQVDAARTAD